MELAVLIIGAAILLGCVIIAASVIFVAWLILRRKVKQDPFPPGTIIMEAPLSEEGFPVEPSGIAIKPDTPLGPGSTVLSFSQGRWWRATVIALEPDDHVRIRYPGWDAKWDTSVPRAELQMYISGSPNPDSRFRGRS